MIAAPVPVPVVLAGPFDHRRRDIDAVTLLKIVAERLGEPADPAAEVQGSTAIEVDPSVVETHHLVADQLASGPEKIVDVPMAEPFAGDCHDGPERILRSECIPILLQLREFHPRVPFAIGTI